MLEMLECLYFISFSFFDMWSHLLIMLEC